LQAHLNINVKLTRQITNNPGCKEPAVKITHDVKLSPSLKAMLQTTLSLFLYCFPLHGSQHAHDTFSAFLQCASRLFKVSLPYVAYNSVVNFK